MLKEIKSTEQIKNLADDLAKSNKKLESANRDLKRLDDAKSEFLSIASHQLRTPLTAIKGLSSMLLEGDYGSIDAKPREVVNNSAQAGKGEIEKNHHTKNFGVVVKVEMASGKKVKEMIKKSQQYQNDKLNLKSGSRYIVLTVEDNGRGISIDDQQRLFQKFARGEGVYTIHTEGTGLGLYVCKKMIEAHKGYIWAESAGDGRGSKFCFAVGSLSRGEMKKC